MPNHVTTELVVRRGSPASGRSLRLFEVQASRHDAANRNAGDRRPLSFWNFVRPEDEILDAYFATANQDNDADPRNWYNWNRLHWGTKWDAYSQESSASYPKGGSAYPETLFYRFQTAWNPPLPVLEAMASQYPDLNFQLTYQDESGPGGRVCAENGVWLPVYELDYPRSHLDANDPRRVLRCDCNESYRPFEDCPEPGETA